MESYITLQDFINCIVTVIQLAANKEPLLHERLSKILKKFENLNCALHKLLSLKIKNIDSINMNNFEPSLQHCSDLFGVPIVSNTPDGSTVELYPRSTNLNKVLKIQLEWRDSAMDLLDELCESVSFSYLNIIIHCNYNTL